MSTMSIRRILYEVTMLAGLLSFCISAFVLRPLDRNRYSRAKITPTWHPLSYQNDKLVFVNAGGEYEGFTQSHVHLEREAPRAPQSTTTNDRVIPSKPGPTDREPVCRVVTRADSKLPPSCLSNLNNTKILASLDSIYHAIAHEETRQLQYMQQTEAVHNAEEDEKLVSLMRFLLEDAGFQRLSRRDMDLCDALNAGYLLRLSLLPDTANLDPDLFHQLYPDLFDESGKLVNDQDELLFDGKVLVFWRGYSAEVTDGRLLLPKLDYLQTSLVQRSATALKSKLDTIERWLAVKTQSWYRKTVRDVLSFLQSIIVQLPDGPLKTTMSSKLATNSTKVYPLLQASPGQLFKLSRYGGSKIRLDPSDALNPFIVCREGSGYSEEFNSDSLAVKDEEELFNSINSGEVMCPYDEARKGSPLGRSPMKFLRRVSLGSLIDLFTRDGRKQLLDTLISKSKLVEPTFERVVVIWRPLPKKETLRPSLKLPLWIYDMADMFDLDGLPARPPKRSEPTPNQLEIRTFSDVPMANLLAVLPKTRLIFRPADAFVFDTATIISLALVFGSFRFDNPRLDLIAFVSGVLWIIRTFFRYSNKLARYDLLVKTFLTSKISHRNMGALKYIATEAGSQRAIRSSIFHNALLQSVGIDDYGPFERKDLIDLGRKTIDQDFQQLKHLPIDLDAAFNDLEDLKLLRKTRDNRYVVVRDSSNVLSTLKKSWCDLFDSNLDLRWMAGRRSKGK